MKNKKQKFDLIGEYKKCFNYLGESRKFIFCVLGIFVFFMLIGFLFPVPEILQEKILETLRQILEETEGLSQPELIFYILSNNIRASFFGILFGFVLGIFPIFASIINGYLLGFVSVMSVNNSGYTSLLQLFPHGIFELPAIFISLGLGLKFGTFMFQKNKSESFKNYLINSLRIFILVVLPLLLVAGIIEGTLVFLGN